MRRLRPLLPRATLSLPSAAAIAASAMVWAAATGCGSTGAHAAAASYLTGIGDQQAEMFTDPLWQRLHTKIARYIAPYDAAVRPYSLDLARAWIKAAEARHIQVLVAFYHSEYTPTEIPSTATYEHDVQKFVTLFPYVREYQSWNEANRGNIPRALASPSAKAAARYYQALIRVCSGCTVGGVDVLDQNNISPTLRYISDFKREIGRLRIVMPTIWGLHNYSDVNRMQSWRTRALGQALGGQVWLTETGGIVELRGAFGNQRGSGLTRAAKVLEYMFKVAGSQSRIRRLYIYNWTGATANARFDAGLTDANHKPRPGYLVVCNRLHGAKCNVKLSNR